MKGFKNKKFLSTGELAALTHLSRDVINSYRKKNLLPVFKVVNGRNFLPHREAVERVRFIQKKRSEGLTLPAIRELLDK